MKDTSITDALAALQSHLGPDAFVLADHWEDDPYAIGLTSPHEPGRLLYLCTLGRPQGRYDLALELPPEPGSELPYTPAGELSDVDLAEVVRVARNHLGLE